MERGAILRIELHHHARQTAPLRVVRVHLLKRRLHRLEDDVHGLRAVDGVYEAELREELHNRHGLRTVGVEPLLYAFRVVVRPPAGLATLEQARFHDLFGAFEHEHATHVRDARHLLLPPSEVVAVAGEAIDEEAPLAALLHGLLEQAHRDLHGHDLALLDVLVYELSFRGATPARSPQKVACGQMLVAVLLHDALALRSLARARPAEDEKDKRTRGARVLRLGELGPQESRVLECGGAPRLNPGAQRGRTRRGHAVLLLVHHAGQGALERARSGLLGVR
mmetsp:Transcript_1437/g.4071  ORF Transcript_1437/g.4071 Transcript_1437/m.4071 type:complete len:280 (-) Transcript_1437:171-1010(-)